MKKEEFLEKLGEIDESFIEEASEGLKKKKTSVYKILSGISAAAAIIIMIVGIGHFTDREKASNDYIINNGSKTKEAFQSEDVSGIVSVDEKSGDMDARADGAVTEQSTAFIPAVTEVVETINETEDSITTQYEELTAEEIYPSNTPTEEDAPKTGEQIIPGDIILEIEGIHLNNGTENKDLAVILTGSVYDSLKQEGTDVFLVLSDGTIKESSERTEKSDLLILFYETDGNTEGLRYQVRDKDGIILSEDSLMVFEDFAEDAVRDIIE